MTDIHIPHTPEKDVNSDNVSIHEIPYDLTARSLARCAGAITSDNHPAADLKAMREALLPLLTSEGDGTRLLHRQCQVLDALFHTLIAHSVRPKEETGPFRPPIDTEKLALALRAQSQCQETLKSVYAADYMKSLQGRMEAGQTRDFVHRLNAPAGTPTPQNSGEQTE